MDLIKKDKQEQYCFNVRDYGAKGDGIADDTTSINNAIAALTQRGGGRLYFPVGTYKITSTVKVNTNNIVICGSGGASVIISGNVGTSRRSLLQVNTNPNQNSVENRLENIIIKDICFNMSTVNPVVWNDAWLTDYGMAVGALTVLGCDNVILENILIKDAVHSGLSVKGCYNVSVTRCSVEGLKTFSPAENLVYDGNCFNFVAHRDSEQFTYTGPMGHYKISDCHVYGSRQWLPPIVNGITTQGNIGIMVQAGGANPNYHQIEPIIVTNCTVEKCWYGIVSEGQGPGGTGSIIVSNNKVKDCVYGIALYPVIPSEIGPASHDFICSDNQLKNIHSIAFIVHGHNVVVKGNVITDWGVARSGVDYGNNINDAYALNVLPCNPANTTPATYRNLIISDNTFLVNTPHDNTYRSPVGGIYISTQNVGIIFENIDIHDNILHGGNSTFGTGNNLSAILLSGSLRYVNVHDNDISGFPRGAIYIQPPNNDPNLAWTPQYVKIHHNRLHDNANQTGGLPAITIVSSNSHYDISDNEVIETGVSNEFLVLNIPIVNFIPLNMNHLIVRNNKSVGLQYGDNDIFSINIAGTNVFIENNAGWNYRTQVPANTVYTRYKNEFVYNTNVVELGTQGNKYIITGWKCIETGKPGKWVEVRALTGN